ncbi:She9p [Sporobolomyces koalae]|uniref:She9p n=1 Tax=Sporobolomyces koalae TaxID=500713 RepID=UPI003170152B
MLGIRSCHACMLTTRALPSALARRSLHSSHKLLLVASSTPTSSPPTTTPTPSTASEPDKPPNRRDVSPLQVKLHEARHTAHLRLKALLATLDTTARKQGQALSAAIEAWELERKLRHVGGKINEATGYEEIERLRISVGDKEKSLLDVRTKALNLKKEYAAKVKLRADSQREVNDLLQRKGSWNSSDVLRFTELVQQDHENEQAEVRAKIAMEAGDEEAEKGFQDFMQAILERYHEEQVWSDKIRAISTYGSLAITSLNVLLFIITLLLIEPWRRRRLVENVEERLRTNTQQGHEATLAQLVSLQNLFSDAQSKLDQLATLAVAAPPASRPTSDEEAPVIAEIAPTQGALDSEPEPLEEPSHHSQEDVRKPRSLETIRSLDDAWLLTKEKIEGHEPVVAGAAGAIGGLILAGLLSAMTR